LEQAQISDNFRLLTGGIWQTLGENSVFQPVLTDPFAFDLNVGLKGGWGRIRVGGSSRHPLSTQSLGHASNASIKQRERHGRLSEYKKAGIVRAGLLRRVFGEIYQTLNKGDHHYDREAHNHETKKAQRRKFLEKNGGKAERTA
jgi:hypothetical protein